MDTKNNNAESNGVADDWRIPGVDPEKTFWYRVAERFGLPVVLLLLGCGFVGLGLKWAATRMLEPAIDRHIKFVDSVEESVKSIDKAINEQARQSEHQTEVLKGLSTLHADQLHELEKISAEQKRGGESDMTQNQLLREINSKLDRDGP